MENKFPSDEEAKETAKPDPSENEDKAVLLSADKNDKSIEEAEKTDKEENSNAEKTEDPYERAKVKWKEVSKEFKKKSGSRDLVAYYCRALGHEDDESEGTDCL